MTSLKDLIKADAAAVQGHLAVAIGPGILGEAMRYAVQGGKGLRGFLVMETARLHDVAPSAAIHPAAAIEAIHAYSLVHDDLPAMDNDDLRRGQPTVHKKWDEATGILVGDGLQALAFEMLGAPAIGPAEVRADLMCTLGRDAFAMVRGQAMDIAAEQAEAPLTLQEITALQNGKTGALIRWAALAGPRLAQADLAPLSAYADRIGLAFQIADDILDETGDAKAMGKAVGKDAAQGKATFVSLLGLDGAKERASNLVTEAMDCLSVYHQRADNLRDLAQFIISRQT